MGIAVSSLLLHDERVPAEARAAIRAAYAAPPEERAAILASAARILRDEADIECRDARELVDLDPPDGCGC